ncbi:MAG: EpsG family protein [Lachnospiraceae bacterium]|nr:EpsG family protein [Lachnospiraceae bacterium]
MQGMMLYTLLLVLGTVIAAYIRPRVQLIRGSRAEALNRLILVILFFLLAVPAVLRVYTGNDYYTYIEHFHDSKLDHYVVTEPGFNLLVKLVYGALDGEYFLVIFGIFSCATVFFFLQAIYKQSADPALSFFLFLALGLYYMSYDTVRYYFALGLVFYSMHYVTKKQWGKFVILVLAAALFHKTALVVLPAYPLARIHWKKWFYGLLAAGAVSGLLFESAWMKLFVWLYPSYVNETEYLEGGSLSIINVARCLGVVALGLMMWQFERKAMEKRPEIGFYLRLNILALILYACFSYIPFVSRIGYYLNVSQLLLLPSLVSLAKGKKRLILYGLVLLAGGLYFIMFLYRASDPLIRVLPYNTWLTVPDGMTPVF